MKLLHALYILLAILIAGACFFAPRAFVPADRPEPRAARVLFVGDMMFDRTIRTIGEEKGYDYLLSCVADYLRGFDLVVGNLEGPITFASSTSAGTVPGQPGNTSFTFSPAVASLLAEHDVRAVSIGNNHILDRGPEGVESTQSVLARAGVTSFGAPGSNASTAVRANGSEIGLVSFNQFLGQNDPARTIRAIGGLKRKGIPVAVYAHWGDEYVPETDAERSLAHEFIDAGADVVIGSHPHVIQSFETYKGRPIYYSLGNFVFDQYWAPEVSTGLGVEAVFADGDVITRAHRFVISRDGRTCRDPVDNLTNI